MARKRCNTCNGEYDDELPDGTEYYHACPPVYDAARQRFVERPEKRDENVPRIAGEREGRRALVSRGRGTTAL